MKNVLQIFNRRGKLALSALQAVGLSAVGVVAGFAAWQYISSSEQDNTAFAPSQYNSGEVVYVAGANTGSYQSGGYYGGNSAEPGSSLNVSAKTVNRMDRQARAEQAAREMAENTSYDSGDSSAPLTAYQTGGTEGLGMGGNVVNEDLLKGDNPLAAMQNSMGDIQNMIANAQQQAQAAAQGQAPGASGAAPAGAPALASAKADWGSSKFSGGSAGSGGFNASFAVQNSGKNRGSSGAAGADEAARQMAAMQAQAKNMLEGSRIRGKSSFGSTENIGGNHDGSVLDGKREKTRQELTMIRKQSADIAANKYRAANEGSRPFLGGEQLSGGIVIDGETLTTGEDIHIPDLDTAYETASGALGGALGDIGGDERNRDKDRLRLLLALYTACPIVLTALPWIVFCCTMARTLLLNPLTAPAAAGWWLKAGLLTTAAVGAAGWLLGESISYASNWGGGPLTTTSGLIASTLLGSIGAAWLPAAWSVVANLKVWFVLTAGPLLGLAGAGVTHLLTGKKQ